MDLAWREYVNFDKIEIEKYAIIIIVVFAVLTRCWYYGDPIVQIDEEFYLYVGDRMRAGLLPYLDIWDRKPIGLFLIYAVIRMLGGAGIIQYQLVATAFAAATAFVVFRIARYDCRPLAAIGAALFYLAWIPLLEGQGGQAPVFYNLFVALAAWVILHAQKDARRGGAKLFGLGALAMALIGLGLQIKYSVVFEGVFLGLSLTYIALRSVKWPIALLMAAAWAIIALIPTLSAACFYALKGQLDVFVFSNFVSILHRRPLGLTASVDNAIHLAKHLVGLLALAALGATYQLSNQRGTASARFVTAWTAASILSVAAFGYYFYHYGLPIVVPAAICAAYLLNDHRPYKWTLSCLVLGLAFISCLYLPMRMGVGAETDRAFEELAAVVRPHAARGVVLWDDLPALLYATSAPLITRYPFPAHLRDDNEWGAVGVDQEKELDRIMAAHPEVVVVNPKEIKSTINNKILLQDLARDYHRIRLVKIGDNDHLVYILNANIPPHPVYPPDQPPPR